MSDRKRVKFSDNWEAMQLREKGYVVIGHKAFNTPQHKKDFLYAASNFPELQRGAESPSLGGFGAMGCPSSHHAPIIRKLRQWAAAVVIPKVLKPYIKILGKRFNIEQYMERSTIRAPGAAPSRESWHRDESIFASGDEQMFGGWINLDSRSQWFSCIPSSQLPDGVHPKKGFATLPKHEGAALKARSKLVEIPPGHILIFRENIIHEVLAKKVPYKLCRIHLGWRLTMDTTIRHDMERVLCDQGVPLVKSGQKAPMYSRNHFAPHIDMLQSWSMVTLKPELLVRMTYKSGKREGESFMIAPRFMKSLREYGYPMYPTYDENECGVYMPSNMWTVLKPGSDSEYVSFNLS